MKVPPKRKGNNELRELNIFEVSPSMKVPPKRKGNLYHAPPFFQSVGVTLNESPSEKEGKF